jgi:Arc/MetJ-type ribon-helix-helix transcriptional regulator
MSLGSRSKLVSFRLTEEEWKRFRDLCYSRGISSVSEMVRAAVNALANDPQRAAPESLEILVNDIEGRLRILAMELRKVAGTDHRPHLSDAANS